MQKAILSSTLAIINIVPEFRDNNYFFTPNWRIALSSGYDFVNKGLSYTSIDIYRDLHCWEMRFNWIPYGTYKSWNFSINVKASALQDLKLTKKKDYRDN